MLVSHLKVKVLTHDHACAWNWLPRPQSSPKLSTLIRDAVSWAYMASDSLSCHLLASSHQVFSELLPNMSFVGVALTLWPKKLVGICIVGCLSTMPERGQGHRVDGR